MSGATAVGPRCLIRLALMITAKKNAPNLADRGKSTFSEGGGDKGACLKKHGCANYSPIHVAVPQKVRAPRPGGVRWHTPGRQPKGHARPPGRSPMP